MTKKETLRIADLYLRLEGHGFTFDEAEAIRKASLTLSRWCERECNGEIEVYEGKPHAAWTDREGQRHLSPIPDRETGAKKRIDKILASHPDWAWYYQTDPRGCAVYLYQPEKMMLLGAWPIDSCYSSIGIAVY